MRIPRISMGTALVAMVVTGTTASAFALSGTVPTPLHFESASSAKTAAVEEPKRPPKPPRPSTTTTTKPERRPEPRPATPPKPIDPPTSVTTVSIPKPEPTTAPAPEPKIERPPTTLPPTSLPPTTVKPIETPRVTEPPKVVDPTTTTTAPRTTTTEKPVVIPMTMSLKCGTAVVNGMNAMSCGWTQSTDPAFGSYRFFRSTDSGAGQILFTSTNPDKHSFGTTTGLVTGESYSYTVQTLDGSGHILATSGPLLVSCCSQIVQN